MKKSDVLIKCIMFLWAFLSLIGLNLQTSFAEPIIIDHTCTDIWQIPESAIEQAKSSLHIAYGHTSHGSQLISGMGSSGTGLDVFMTNNGATPALYVWHDGPQAGALDLDDYFVSGDLGNPDRTTWAQRTRDYLDNPANFDVNVVIWSWCGQVDGTEEEINTYLNLMNQLESDYPNVIFVYMTGHLNGTGASGNVNIRNNQIRNFCVANDKVLYDFADIESYDPDGLVNYMELRANDNCDYDSDGNGSQDRNWALGWQGSHIEGVDWWPSGAAHSQHLNGNLKGYAAWWLWARLAGWNPSSSSPNDDNDDVPDGDNDGVPDEEEQGPNGTELDFDGNGDTIPDFQQENVASGHTYDGQDYVTIAVPGPPHMTTLGDCNLVDNPSPGDAPADVEFQYNFFEFTVNGVGPGGSTTVTIYLPAGAAPATYYKYGPTPGNLNDHWYEFMYDGQTGAVINGNIITLHFVDGLRGDDDLNNTNGTVVDQGAPGFPIIQPKSSATNGGSEGGGCFISTAAKGIF